MPAEAKYLLMVEPGDTGDGIDHNKFYRMVPRPDGRMFDVEYGRVGARPMKRSYPMSKWHMTYDSKIRKGYSDMSRLHEIKIVEKNPDEGQTAGITEKAVRALVESLMAFADRTIRKAYTVKSKEVNRRLTRLFAVIPRRMSNVRENMAEGKKDFAGIIEREQEILDTMKGQVRVDTKSAKTRKKSGGGDTVLDKMGVEIRECTDEEAEEIKKHMDADTAQKFRRAFRVVNRDTEEAYEKFKKEHGIGRRGEKFLYHGSRNENFWSIVTTGLSLSPNAAITGKMFGNGIYFAPKAAKSAGYTSLQGFWARRNGAVMHDRGYLAVYKVATGKAYRTDEWRHEFTSFTRKDMDRLGCDSFLAKAGKNLYNDEVIVYREDQCTIRYLVEIG